MIADFEIRVFSRSTGKTKIFSIYTSKTQIEVFELLKTKIKKIKGIGLKNPTPKEN